MEENKMTTDVVELKRKNEELQKKVEELTKQLDRQKCLEEAYKKASEEYRSYWLNSVDKIKKMKEDIEDVQKLANKLIERW